MGFGIKTKIKEVFYVVRHTNFFYKNLLNDSFPQRSYSKLQINSRLAESLFDEKSLNSQSRLGTLISKADKYAVEIYQKFIAVNPNNIGNWSVATPFGGTKQLERELIRKLISLYSGKKQKLEGYFTSGGQEGNLYSVWLAKSYLAKKHEIQQICLIKTKLAHYSVDKGALIGSIKLIDVPLHPKTWNMDPSTLLLEVEKQIKKGMRGFIISLTIGYSQTGTSDNVEEIDALIQKLKKMHKGITFSIIIDAAFNGLVEPFVSNNFQPFVSQNVHAFCVDFSKFTAVPYPAGAVLYRKELREIIERQVSVAPIPDNTLLGSRSGAPVAAVWATIHHFGFNGYKKIVIKQIKLKEYFIKKILEIFPEAEVINGQHSLSCGIILNKKHDKKLSKQVSDRYWIYAKEESLSFSNRTTRSVRIYKFFFLPHITKKAVDEVILSIKNSH